MWQITRMFFAQCRNQQLISCCLKHYIIYYLMVSFFFSLLSAVTKSTEKGGEFVSGELAFWIEREGSETSVGRLLTSVRTHRIFSYCPTIMSPWKSIFRDIELEQQTIMLHYWSHWMTLSKIAFRKQSMKTRSGMWQDGLTHLEAFCFLRHTYTDTHTHARTLLFNLLNLLQWLSC